MRTVAVSVKGRMQFGLMELMEVVTICAILFALSPATGVTTSILLAMMALALAARRGSLALVMLAAASIAADWPFGTAEQDGMLRQLIVILISILLCTWYRLRCTWHPCKS